MLNRTSESYQPSIGDETRLDMTINNELENLLSHVSLEEDLSRPAMDDGPHYELHRLLSIHTIVSTASSEAKGKNQAQEKDHDEWDLIGAGQCGTIFSCVGKSQVMKICNADWDPDALWIDWVGHQSIFQYLGKYRTSVPDVIVPTPLDFFPKDDDEFLKNYEGLRDAANRAFDKHKKTKLPAAMILSERIQPLPEAVRNALIETFCHPDMKQKVRDAPANKDCLLRVYLGSVNTRPPSPVAFTLRNFHFHLNQMELLRLDINGLASTMGRTLAVIHWAAKYDGRDIEFVLGSKTCTRKIDLEELQKCTVPTRFKRPENPKSIEDYYHRKTELFCLDFNLVAPIGMDRAGAEMAAQAFADNDPYFPKPHQKSKVARSAWNTFAYSYFEMAQSILKDPEDSPSLLPLYFLQKVSELEGEKLSVTALW